MKKITLLFIAFVLFLCSCSKQEDKTQILDDFISNDGLKLPTEISESTAFPESFSFKNETINVTYESDNADVLSNSGEAVFSSDDEYVTLKVTLTHGDETKTIYHDITLKGKTNEELLLLCGAKINIPSSIDGDIILPSRVKYGSTSASCTWKSNASSILTDNGTYSYPDANTEIELTCTLSNKNGTIDLKFKSIAKALDKTNYLAKLASIDIKNETDSDLTLPKTITINDKTYDVTWSSNNGNISNDGKIKYVEINTQTKLTASIQVKNVTITKEWEVIVKPASELKVIQDTISCITVPALINNDIYLPTNINGVEIKWISSDDSVITSEGKINKKNQNYKAVCLTAELTAGKTTESVEFNVQASYEPHMFIDRTFEGEKANTEVIDGKLVLQSGSLTGTYTTPVIETADFTEAVGSYAATSSENEVCELKVRIRIGSSWTKYFTYGEFGKGLKNGYSDQTDTLAKIVEDEIKAIGTNKANAFQIQLKLKRNSISLEGPKVTLVALAIKFVELNYNFDIKNIEKEKKYDLVKLYQHDVPEIGGSICSCTSSTMLLMYKGYSFDGLAAYPHQYIAGIVKDYGHNVFGNWSYNCIGMSSFGATTYVKRFYSYQELLYHLCYVGPVAASIKGTMITDAKTYTTGGHLIDVTGYKIEDNQIYIYINDPNIKSVATRCKLENFLNVYRFVSYIIE